MLHVADVTRSLRFYALLGFETIATEGEGGHVGWARAHGEGDAGMLNGEIHVKDPDGYSILVGHGGKSEHDAWEKRLAAKKKHATS
jgi:hypothetical protein